MSTATEAEAAAAADAAAAVAAAVAAVAEESLAGTEVTDTTEGEAGKKRAADDDEEDKKPAAKRRRKKKEQKVKWNDMLYEVIRYKNQHGHLRVSPHGPFGSWVAKQRHQYHAMRPKVKKDDDEEKVEGAPPMEPAAVEPSPEEDSKKVVKKKRDFGPEGLNEERIEVLDSLGFVWDVVKADYDARWENRFKELQEYIKVHGHCVVPQSTKLGQWVKIQRENKREADLRAAGNLPSSRRKPKPCLSQYRQDKLNSIGFQWRVAKPPIGWEARYQQLVEYKKVHGDCNVPQAYPPDKPFGRWVMKQRCEHSAKQRGQKSQMTEEREARLNALGFSWVAPNFRRKAVMDQVEAAAPAGVVPAAPAGVVPDGQLEEDAGAALLAASAVRV